MRFTDGLWMHRSGLSIHNTHQMWEYRIEQDRIKAFVLCHCVEEADDYTAGTALEYTFSCPAPDMIAVDVVHFRGTTVKEPAFTLHYAKAEPQITDTAESLVMENGRMRLVIRKSKQFAYDFYFDGRHLTGSENGSTAYIADADYEADKVDDVNHRTPKKPYMHTVYLRERLQLGIGEAIYGLGERFTPLIRNGQVLDIWNRDGGSNCDQGYKCVPFYLSNLGYGVLVNTPDYVRFDVGMESVRHVQFSVEDEELSYIVVGGEDAKDVLSRYTALIGRSPVPPVWTFGLWLSTSWIPDSTEKTALAAIDKMHEYGIPLSVYHFDARWMDDFHDCNFVWSDRFGDARHMIDEIHKRGVKVCVWINPYVSQISRLFAEGMEGGYFIKNKNGDVWQTDMWMCGTAYVDFTNPAAAKWYTDRLGEILDMGVDCIKTDFGERLPTDIVYYDGSDPRRMHNYYTYLYNKAIYELLVEKKGMQEACVFARSATVGTQLFPINWGGDNQASYLSMAESLRGGLSFCQSGYGYWCHDITGFEDTATPDLYKRWSAFGLLCTHSRLHGHKSLRMPWCFDEESCDVLRHFTRLKCSLMPYLYSEATLVHTKGVPEMRSMMLEFPHDPTCAYLDRQYMLGGALLVAPIFNDRGEVTFYVPAGCWTDLQSGKRYEGGRWYTESYDYFGLPILVRPGTLLARNVDADDVVYDYASGLTLDVYELADGQTASCEIVKMYETEGCTLSAARTGTTVTLKLGGTQVKAIRLHGCTAVKAEGAVIENGCLIPADGADTICCTVEE